MCGGNLKRGERRVWRRPITWTKVIIMDEGHNNYVGNMCIHVPPQWGSQKWWPLTLQKKKTKRQLDEVQTVRYFFTPRSAITPSPPASLVKILAALLDHSAVTHTASRPVRHNNFGPSWSNADQALCSVVVFVRGESDRLATETSCSFNRLISIHSRMSQVLLY